MAEYIDRELVMAIPLRNDHYYIKNDCNKAYQEGWKDALELIGLIPAADVRENKGGKWISHKLNGFESGYEPTLGFDCTSCGAWIIGGDSIKGYAFCPNCGACMT